MESIIIIWARFSNRVFIRMSMWVIRANNHIQVLKGRTATIRPKAGTANKNYTTAF